MVTAGNFTSSFPGSLWSHLNDNGHPGNEVANNRVSVPLFFFQMGFGFLQLYLIFVEELLFSDYRSLNIHAINWL